ncbi:hypothetical protein CTAYLR_005613 [Chrysophaeum taylorii]|uniref:Replication protein A subunit n=1 Tax=Chrysophaeum taylorii TaxID=2483200 RepID=A0AAD7U7Y7_9STRA|nr:hypothetical protein CTAYLR_005613 [Chrysophaeum taylorii]
MVEVTLGAIAAIMAEQVDRDTFHPILQVLDIRNLKGSERYRLICSDSNNYTQCMAASQLNRLIAAGQLEQGSLIKLEKYLVNSLQNHRIIIVLNFHVVSGPRPKIGLPTPVGSQDDKQQNQPPRQQDQPPPNVPAQRQQYQPQPPRQQQQPAQRYDQQRYDQQQPTSAQRYDQQQPTSAQRYDQQQPTSAQRYDQQQPTSAQRYDQHQPTSAQRYDQPHFDQQVQRNNQQQPPPHQPQQQSLLQRRPFSVLSTGNTEPGARPSVKRGGGPPSGANSISSLNPYLQRFTLRARITTKYAKKEWNKPTSQGQLFSIDLADESGEIRGTFFRDLVDRYLNTLEEGKIYIISDSSARIKPANKQWTSLSHEFEINFGNATFEEARDDGSIPVIQGTFIKLRQLARQTPPEGDKVDLVAVVKKADPISSFISKRDNLERKKREVTIVDDSGYDVRLTFWGEVSEQPDDFWERHPVVLAKGCRVSSFGGLSLSTSFSGMVKFDVQSDPETVRLRRWWASGGSEATSSPLTNSGTGGSFAPVPFEHRGVVDDIKTKNLGFQEKPSYLTFKGTLNFIKPERMWYEACTNEGCQKKVTQQSDDSWHCEKCQTTLEDCRRRYMVTGTLIDHTAQTWVTAFNDSALVIFESVTADQIAVYKEEVENHAGVFEDYIKGYLFRQFVVKVRVKNEMWQEQSRVKTSIVSIAPLDFVEESRALLDAIAHL